MAKVGIVSSKGLKRVRRYAYVGMFVVAAILAPPDVITQIGLALPLIGLYEISIFAATFVEPKPVEQETDTDA
jgi:sec-independent protein translocase protein TatC